MYCQLLSPSCSGSSGLTDLTFYLSAPLGYLIGTLNSACLKPNSCCLPLPPEPAQSLVSTSINANFIPPSFGPLGSSVWHLYWAIRKSCWLYHQPKSSIRGIKSLLPHTSTSWAKPPFPLIWTIWTAPSRASLLLNCPPVFSAAQRWSFENVK